MPNGSPAGGYKPFTKSSWEKIEKGWNLYRSAIGLEGDLYLQLKKQNLSEEKIFKKIEEYRESKKGLMEGYRKEVGRNG